MSNGTAQINGRLSKNHDNKTPIVVSFEFETTFRPGHIPYSEWTSNPNIHQVLYQFSSQSITKYEPQYFPANTNSAEANAHATSISTSGGSA